VASAAEVHRVDVARAAADSAVAQLRMANASHVPIHANRRLAIARVFQLRAQSPVVNATSPGDTIPRQAAIIAVQDTALRAYALEQIADSADLVRAETAIARLEARGAAADTAITVALNVGRCRGHCGWERGRHRRTASHARRVAIDRETPMTRPGSVLSDGTFSKVSTIETWRCTHCREWTRPSRSADGKSCERCPRPR